MSALDDVIGFAVDYTSISAYPETLEAALKELELLRENAFSLAHAMLTRDIGVCTSCGIPLSGVHSHREQTGCSFVRVIRTDPERAKKMGLGWAL